MTTLTKGTTLLWYKNAAVSNIAYRAFYKYNDNFNYHESGQTSRIFLCKLLRDVTLNVINADTDNVNHLIRTADGRICYNLSDNVTKIFMLRCDDVQYVKSTSTILLSGIVIRRSGLLTEDYTLVEDAIGLSIFTIVVVWLLHQIIRH